MKDMPVFALGNQSNDQSRFRTMINMLRADLIDEKDCLYVMHTPAGIINISKWGYSITGFVTITGEDEDNQFRLLVFSDDAACSFPLEIKRKKLKGSKKTLGFKSTTGKS
jgi:DNA-binding winged helix-turn-helix (wHTH) protein